MKITVDINSDDWKFFQFVARDKSPDDQILLASIISQEAIQAYIDCRLEKGPYLVEKSTQGGFWIMYCEEGSTPRFVDGATLYTQYSNAARACKRLNRKHNLDLMNGDTNG